MSEFSVSIRNYDDACALAKILIDNDYVVMLSVEEQLYIVSAIWSERHADRNDVVFMNRCTFEEKYVEVDPNDRCED